MLYFDKATRDAAGQFITAARHASNTFGETFSATIAGSFDTDKDRADACLVLERSTGPTSSVLEAHKSELLEVGFFPRFRLEGTIDAIDCRVDIDVL